MCFHADRIDRLVRNGFSHHGERELRAQVWLLWTWSVHHTSKISRPLQKRSFRSCWRAPEAQRAVSGFHGSWHERAWRKRVHSVFGCGVQRGVLVMSYVFGEPPKICRPEDFTWSWGG